MQKLTTDERKIAKKFGHMFINTGGNDPIELMEREGVNYFNNPVIAMLQGSCYSQTVLMLKLQRESMLVQPGTCNAIGRLLTALDGMDRGCTEPGFNGHQNGYGEESAGDELQAAREGLAALVGHVAAIEVEVPEIPWVETPMPSTQI